ncbi:MAG: cell wall-binding repeat-containing protein [Acidimicrobiales bacterium]|nr:cell wall-binding repeat-containing protein [Acidimicrobiales bacterium]MYD83364.1 cell wall-binding repeat-containing protein [Acidimicrobiales bacterium]MYJ64312.1 cell wall-binding repeat-containing protein [Acidimicrobiales bacterium]
MPVATSQHSISRGGHRSASRWTVVRRQRRRAAAFCAVAVAAASLAVISPPAAEPVAAALKAPPLDATCSELNAMVGHPTRTYIVRQGIRFLSDSAADVGPGSDDTYGSGETVRIQVTLSLNASWGRRDDLYADAEELHITFMLGSTPKEAVATPVEGRGSNLLTFEYTLDPGDGNHSARDVWIPENSVVANDFAKTFGRDAPYDDGAAHQFISGPCGGAQVEHPAVFHPQTPGSPTIVSRPRIMSEPHSGDTYYEGEKIWVRVEYSEPVTVTGTPVIKLRFGSDTDTNPSYRDASYVSDSASDPPNDPRRRSSMHRLLFEYVVQSGDNDSDGFSIDWGQLSGGSIVAMDNGVAATRNHDGLAARVEAEARGGGDPTVAKHLVDGSRGLKTSPELHDTGDPAVIQSYATRVVSEPRSGATLHDGEYVVVRADFNESVVVSDTRLELPIELFNCHDADFNHRSQLSGTDLDSYDAELAELGCWDDSTDTKLNPTRRYAKYFSGSGSSRLLFAYQITSLDEDRDGIVVPDDSELTYDGGTQITSSIQDSIISAHGGGSLHVGYSDVFKKPLKYQRADGQAVEGPPIITALTITSDPNSGDNDPLDYYEHQDTVEIQVTFNQGVVVTGTPLLALNIGGVLKNAEYSSGDGTTSLLFRYTVEAGDEDAVGIGINRDSLTLGNGTLTALDDGEGASLDHHPLSRQREHKVDAAVPTITGLRIASSPPNGGTHYGVGLAINIEVSYDEAVTVSGTPSFDFEVGTVTKTAYYDQTESDADSNGRTIVFRYTVQDGDEDADGIAAPDPEIVGGTITDARQNANPLPADRDHPPLGTQPAHRVETDPPEVDSAAGSVALTSQGTGTGGEYVVDDLIDVTVTFDEIVYVDETGGTPHIGIDIGGTTQQASYVRGSGAGNRRLVFSYEVPEGLIDTDGIEVVENSLAFNNGDITDRAGNRAILDHEAADGVSGDTNTHTVDSIVPTITGGLRISSCPPNCAPPEGNDTYGLGDIIMFEVDFSEDVEVQGVPVLRFQIGDDAVTPANNHRNARLTGSSAGCTEADTGTCTLTFSYTVGSNDDDNDGISVDLDATLSPPETTAVSGTISDRTGNRANLTHDALPDDSDHKVDAQPPRVSTIEITSTASRHNSTYRSGDTITIDVTFDDPIKLTLDDGDADTDDNPQIALRLGSGAKYADYVSHQETDSNGVGVVTFSYDVEGDDLDMDGIGFPSNALQRRDAAIADPQGQTATLANMSIDDSMDHKVDGVAPTVTGVGVSSEPPRTESPYLNDKYGVYDSTSNDLPILVKVTFSEAVKLSTGSSIDVTIGTTDRSAIWVEPDGYSTTAGTREAIFRYEVASSDTDDTDGIDIVENSLSGTITDLVDNSANLTHGAQNSLADHKVDTTAPSVTEVSITSPSPDGNLEYDKTYARGDTIMVTVTFSEKVAVNGDGTPKLKLNIGGGTSEEAAFQPGDGSTNGDNTTKLMFTYVVAAGDEDTDGISIDADSIELNGSTITDLAGNDAALTHDAVPDDGDRKVDGDLSPRGPYATSISMYDGPDKLGTYRAGEHIFFDVTFSEPVTVGGTPMLPIIVGNQKEAGYHSKPSSTTLRFRYTVQAGDLDDDGVSAAAVSIDLDGGTIRATAGSADALLGVPELADQPGHEVDGVAPSVVGTPRITSDPTLNDDDPPNTYEKDDVIEVTVEFDEGVIVSGTPYINIVLKTGTMRADQSGPAMIDPGTGTTTLTFSYTVSGGDKDIDGVSILADQLHGTITDPVGNAANRSHDPVLDDAGHLVDGGNWPGHGKPSGTSSSGGGTTGNQGRNPVESENHGDDNWGVRVERIGGVDRFETAKLIAERYVREVAQDTSLPPDMRKVDTVIIASGRAFPDALSASSLAGSILSPIALSGPALAGTHQAPLLLVEPHELTRFTREFLTENEIEQVYIVGGPAAVSNGVEDEIAALPSVTSVTRFGGADRYDTSVSISSEVIAMMGSAAEFCGTSLRTALLATGTDFADALALAPIAAKGPHPLLLTRPDELPASVRSYLEAASAARSIEQIIIAGGPNAVSDDVIDELTAMGFSVVRIGGVDRYDTSVRIAKYALRAAVSGHGACLDNNRVGLATGEVYADGLAGGPLLALLNGAGVLLEPDALPRVVRSFLAWYRLDHQDLTLTVFGGRAALSYGVIRLAKEAAERGLP